jgi:hypothetical protein
MESHPLYVVTDDIAATVAVQLSGCAVQPLRYRFSGEFIDFERGGMKRPGDLFQLVITGEAWNADLGLDGFELVASEAALQFFKKHGLDHCDVAVCDE